MSGGHTTGDAGNALLEPFGHMIRHGSRLARGQATDGGTEFFSGQPVSGGHTTGHAGNALLEPSGHMIRHGSRPAGGQATDGGTEFFSGQPVSGGHTSCERRRSDYQKDDGDDHG
jgi:hypothetical protein